MYDWPEVRAATDTLWAAIGDRLRDAGIQAPRSLKRSVSPDQLWHAPDLVFGQTCGYPYAKSLRGIVRLIATPCHHADGCDGPFYSSVLLVRADEPATSLGAMAERLAAVNNPMSLSGCLVLRAALAAANIDNLRGLMSGSHRESIRMVADCDADLCAVDAVCWALARAHEPALAARLRVLDRTPPMPALPYICAAATSDKTVDHARAALTDALADPAQADACRALHLGGAMPLDDRDYDAVLALEPGAAMLEFAARD